MERGAAVDVDDLGDPVPVDELECLVIVHAFRGICIEIFAGVQDKVVLVQFLRRQVTEFRKNWMSSPAEELGRRAKQEMFLQVAQREKFSDLFRPMGRVHDEADIRPVRVEVLNDLGARHLPVEKTERRVSVGTCHADKGVVCVGTAACGDPKAEGIGVFLEGLTEMIRMLQEITAHVKEETAGFCRHDPVFSTSKDRESVFFFCLPEDLAEVRLGHGEAFRGGGDGAAV